MDQELHIVSGNEVVTLTCNVAGDDISGAYWERVTGGGPLPNQNNMSSLSNDNRTVTMKITEVRPEHSGRYHCVAYSQWGMDQSINVTVAIKSNMDSIIFIFI